MCGVAQEQLQNESTIFKAIEAKFKLDRRQVYWALYTERGLKEDTIHKLVVFPLKKRSKDKMLYDAYVVLYNLQKQMIDNYYIGEGEWEDSDRGRLQGLEVASQTPLLGKKAIAYQVRVFFSNADRNKPKGSEVLTYFISKGKKLQKVLSTDMFSYTADIFGGGTAKTPCEGEKKEVSSKLHISEHKVRGFYTIEETRVTKQIKIERDAEGFCAERVVDSKEDVGNRELIKIATTEKYYERDPKNDVKDGGIVAIDFGTKSTVVAIQTQNEKTSLVRIAGGSYKKNVEKSQFENPTIMEFIDIESFEKAYSESKGRPFTKWDDLKVSYAANSSFIGGSKFILEGLKQWAGNKDEKLVIYDKKWKRIDLKPYIDY